MAIEDALVLDEEFQRGAGLAGALAAYEERRRRGASGSASRAWPCPNLSADLRTFETVRCASMQRMPSASDTGRW